MAESCHDCSHFENDPARIEAALPGIRALSSAYGSAMGQAGLCAAHGTLTDPVPASSCPEFERVGGSGRSGPSGSGRS